MTSRDRTGTGGRYGARRQWERVRGVRINGDLASADMSSMSADDLPYLLKQQQVAIAHM